MYVSVCACVCEGVCECDCVIFVLVNVCGDD